jgi:hypothetical protein
MQQAAAAAELHYKKRNINHNLMLLLLLLLVCHFVFTRLAATGLLDCPTSMPSCKAPSALGTLVCSSHC